MISPPGPEAAAMEKCPTCSTTLDSDGKCVSCTATADGLVQLVRLEYATTREMLTLLEEAGLAAQMERVPPANEHEQRQPRWNLYVSREDAEKAAGLLGRDWRDLLGGEDAIEAARRGATGVDLDAGGEITCPACGHRFVAEGAAVECPDCGLGLGAPE
jgi:hypothetical protein